MKIVENRDSYGENQHRIIPLCDLGVGGQKGIVYHAYALSPSLTATQYKDPPKLITRKKTGYARRSSD